MPPPTGKKAIIAAEEAAAARASAQAQECAQKARQEMQEAILEVEFGEDMCIGIVEEVVALTEREISRLYIDTTAIPFTVQCVAADLMDMLHMAFAEHEDIALMDVDEEWEQVPPQCPQIASDSWARGALLHRRKIIDPESPKWAKAAGNKMRSSGFTNSSQKVGVTSDESIMNSSFTGNPFRAKKTGSADRRKSNISESPAASVPDTGATPMEEPLKTEDEIAIMESLQMEEARRSVARETSERLTKQLAEITKASTPFTVDCHHKSVIPVHPVDAKHLPPPKAEMKVAISKDPETAPPAPAPKKRRGVGASTKKKSNGPKEDRPAENCWMPEQKSEPMVSNVQPAAGVGSREGDTQKKLDLKPQKNRMSRQEFQKMVQMQAAANAAVSAPNEEVVLDAKSKRQSFSKTGNFSLRSEGDTSEVKKEGDPSPSPVEPRGITPQGAAKLPKRPASEMKGVRKHVVPGRGATPTAGMMRRVSLSLSEPTEPASSAPIRSTVMFGEEGDVTRDFLEGLNEE